MVKLAQFRDPLLSLFQSAVDEVAAKKAAAQSQAAGTAPPAIRPNPTNSAMVNAATAHVTNVAAAQSAGGATTAAIPPPATAAPPDQPAAAAPPLAQQASSDLSQQLDYCASLARNYALAAFEHRDADAAHYHALLTTPFGDCDPGWVDTSLKYEEFLVSKQPIPYRVYKSIGDFAIDGKLPVNAKIAIVGDWGTGQTVAKNVLAQIARKQPDVVIHLGDVYYSGTDFEMQTYFYDIWQQTLDLKNTATFTLAGNHDMFSGGAPYYKLIDQLGQPASYFCLRNDYWQFVVMDTGLHDDKPDGTAPTYLEDTEVAWVTDKIQNAGGRRTVFLSHHQLFAAYEDICGNAVNDHLNSQLSALLPKVDLWLWGHEHNLVIYEKYMGVLARCIGHGAFPVGVSEIPDTPKFPEVPVTPLRVGNDGNFYNHGYAMMELNGSSATISYYQDTDEANPQFVETLAAPALAAT